LLDRARRAVAEVLNSLISSGSRCALVDFPAHANVGDSAIWLGERAYLRDRRVSVAYSCDAKNYVKEDLARALDVTETILIHGGGNFGDLWPLHQAFRLQLMQDWPGRRIIQLPQTVHFRSTQSRDETRRGIDAHGNFHMVVRDRRSYEAYLRDFSPACSLAPDMALFLGEPRIDDAPSGDFFWLRRTDKESQEATTPELVSGIHTDDWLEDGERLQRVVMSLRNWKKRWFGVRHLEQALYDPFARARVRRGYQALRQGRVVITERLHGHILCLLAGIPHVLIDNNYGKNAEVYWTWTHGWRGTRFVSTPAEARGQAEDLLRLWDAG
jgi:exopolysaccharide biosynthesis predicted pyruvyltransferase EpsI